MTRVAIFDYGAGNIFSLKNSLEREGATADVIRDFATRPGGDGDRSRRGGDGNGNNVNDAARRYDGLLLPGVGNFDPAMKAVTRDPDSRFSDYVGHGMPVLGICLGMEMFFARSQEGSEPGLGVMSGDVASLPDTMKVPHMGWNSLQIRRRGRLLEGVEDGAWVYFVHSYMARLPATPPPGGAGGGDVVTAESSYNDVVIPAAVEYRNYLGTQFHPEKSGPVGRQMIRNFLGVCRR